MLINSSRRLLVPDAHVIGEIDRPNVSDYRDGSGIGSEAGGPRWVLSAYGVLIDGSDFLRGNVRVADIDRARASPDARIEPEARCTMASPTTGVRSMKWVGDFSRVGSTT